MRKNNLKLRMLAVFLVTVTVLAISGLVLVRNATAMEDIRFLSRYGLVGNINQSLLPWYSFSPEKWYSFEHVSYLDRGGSISEKVIKESASWSVVSENGDSEVFTVVTGGGSKHDFDTGKTQAYDAITDYSSSNSAHCQGKYFQNEEEQLERIGILIGENVGVGSEYALELMFEYYADGAMERQTLMHEKQIQMYRVYFYDDLGRLIRTEDYSGEELLLEYAEYSHDSKGRITATVFDPAAEILEHSVVQVDGEGNVTQIDHFNASDQLMDRTVFLYDKAEVLRRPENIMLFTITWGCILFLGCCACCAVYRLDKKE